MNEPDTNRFARLIHAIDPDATLMTYWPLTGGVSAQTTALEIEPDGGAPRRVVVRAYGDADIARDALIAEHEYRLLQAVRDAGLPVPAPVYADPSGEIFGSPALVIEFIDGDVIVDPVAPARYVAEMAAWMARIHAVDLTTSDLSFLARKEAELDDQVRSPAGESPLVQEIQHALNGYWPPRSGNEPVLLHGDFWWFNLLWKDGELAAIIDWEDAAIGDPLADVSRTRLELHWTLGEMARERFTSHYQSYRDINLDGLAVWDLATAIGLAGALATWGLPTERERQMRQALEQFVQDAKEQLAIDRSQEW